MQPHTNKLYWYGSRWYDPYITQFSQPDPIIPDPYNTLDWNRYQYARSNPLKYTDPSGHYVCTGYNKEWGKQTCYDIIDAYLDFLRAHGGTEGQSLVEQFQKADAINPISFNFGETPPKVWAQTNPIANSILININAGTSTDYSKLGDESAMLGHELYHLLYQDAAAQLRVETEKAAYDFQAKLLQNMGITPDPESPVAIISSLDLQKDYKLIETDLNLDPKNMSWIQQVNMHTGVIGYPIAQALYSLITNLTGCYGSVCVAPGEPTHQYSP